MSAFFATSLTKANAFWFIIFGLSNQCYLIIRQIYNETYIIHLFRFDLKKHFPRWPPRVTVWIRKLKFPWIPFLSWPLLGWPVPMRTLWCLSSLKKWMETMRKLPNWCWMLFEKQIHSNSCYCWRLVLKVGRDTSVQLKNIDVITRSLLVVRES